MTSAAIITKKNFSLIDKAFSFYQKRHERAINDAAQTKDFTAIKSMSFFKDLSESDIISFGASLVLCEVTDISGFYLSQSLPNASMDEVINFSVEQKRGNYDDLIDLISSSQEKKKIVENLIDFILKKKNLLNFTKGEFYNAVINTPEYKEYLKTFGWNVESYHSSGVMSSDDKRSWNEIFESSFLHDVLDGVMPVFTVAKFYQEQNPSINAKELVASALVAPIIRRTCSCCKKDYPLILNFSSWNVTDAATKMFAHLNFECSMKKPGDVPFGSDITVTSGKLAVFYGSETNLYYSKPQYKHFKENLEVEGNLMAGLNENDTLGCSLITAATAELDNIAMLMFFHDDAVIDVQNGNLVIDVANEEYDEEEDEYLHKEDVNMVSLSAPYIYVADKSVMDKIFAGDENYNDENCKVFDFPNGTYRIAVNDSVIDKKNPICSVIKVSDDCKKKEKSAKDLLDTLGVSVIPQSKIFKLRIGNRGSRM